MWWKAMLLVVLALVIAVAGALIYGKVHWQTEAKDLCKRLAAAQLPPRTKIFAYEFAGTHSNQGFVAC